MKSHFFPAPSMTYAFALVTTVALGCGGGRETTASGGSGGSGGQVATTSSSSTTSSTSSDTGSNTGGSAPDCMEEGTVLAASKLHFGDGNSGQWKKIGFNLDGLVSNANSTDVCKVYPGGNPSTAYPDGEQGLDNSFAKNLLPQILAVYPTFTSDVNNNIANGTTTVLFKIECLPEAGDAPVLVTKLFGGRPLGTLPKWDGTDEWPVAPELLGDPMDPHSAAVVFPNSSVKDDVFDAGKNATFIITIPVATQTGSTSLKLTLYAAKMTMTLSADRKSATGGLIGGVLDTEEFVAELKKIAGLFNVCDNPLYDALIEQVRQASDIMNDGTQDPSKTCNAISMGLGFEMKAAQLGDVGPDAPAGSSCP